MGDFVSDYFIGPIFDRTGYNAINTLTYAIVALFAIYAIWRAFKAWKIDFSSREFLFGVGAFVLFGASARVLTDLSDAGAFAVAAKTAGALAPAYSAIYASGIFSYGYLTVTPGIYLVTAALYLLSVALSKAMKQGMFCAYAGALLSLPCILLLLPFMAHLYYGALAIAIAAAGSLAAWEVLRRAGGMELGLHQRLAIFGQALDGAATFVVIDIFGKETGRNYFEQHILSAGIGESTPLGFFFFFLVKVALASAIVYFLGKEDMKAQDKAFVLILVGVMGFGPGLRDLFRMVAGT